MEVGMKHQPRSWHDPTWDCDMNTHWSKGLTAGVLIKSAINTNNKEQQRVSASVVLCGLFLLLCI